MEIHKSPHTHPVLRHHYAQQFICYHGRAHLCPHSCPNHATSAFRSCLILSEKETFNYQSSSFIAKSHQRTTTDMLCTFRIACQDQVRLKT